MFLARSRLFLLRERRSQSDDLLVCAIFRSIVPRALPPQHAKSEIVRSLRLVAGADLSPCAPGRNGHNVAALLAYSRGYPSNLACRNSRQISDHDRVVWKRSKYGETTPQSVAMI
jgi:hypothetical protein